MTRKKYPKQYSLSLTEEDHAYVKRQANGFGISVAGFWRLLLNSYRAENIQRNKPETP